ncbi:ABC transporter permease [Arthrobacter sp. 18067]|uniref:ABC transporter permease n=1 Tax=Arthrobacter sp. 18067 TaxID=2681413 RepID=UPI00135A6721|nr:ABC transporter permease [Arthrobacter sp. 18067]
MTRFLVRRLGLLALVVWGVVTATFILVHATPGDPARATLGDKASESAVQALRAEWGLDQPLGVQYWHFLMDLVGGNLGTSFQYRSPIVSLLAERLPTTLLLMLMAVTFAVVISLPLATWVAVRGRGGADIGVRIFGAVVQGTPAFLTGTLLVIIFGLKLRWFPVGGYGSTTAEHLYSLVLPALTIALGIVPMLLNSLRASLTDALQSDFVAFGHSKGLRPATVLAAYAIRNGSISGVTILGIQAGALAGGALVVEKVFAIPGMGSLMLAGILGRDFPVVQATTLVFAGIVVVVYLVTDLSYALLDPRARLA